MAKQWALRGAGQPVIKHLRELSHACPPTRQPNVKGPQNWPRKRFRSAVTCPGVCVWGRWPARWGGDCGQCHARSFNGPSIRDMQHAPSPPKSQDCKPARLKRNAGLLQIHGENLHSVSIKKVIRRCDGTSVARRRTAKNKHLRLMRHLADASSGSHRRRRPPRSSGAICKQS